MVALHQIRAVALTGYDNVARAAGLDPAAMLERHGISPDCLGNPEERLSATAVAEMLENSAHESGDDGFGLAMAEQRSFESLGPVTNLYRPLGSFRELIQATIEGRRLLNDVIEFEIADSGGAGDGFIAVRLLPQFSCAQTIILLAAMTHRTLEAASRGRWKPLAVHFRHRPPADPARFDRFFGAPVRFTQSSDGFVCDRGSLEKRWHSEADLGHAFETIRSLEEQIARLKRISDGAQPDLIRSLEEALVEIRLAAEQLSG